MANSRSGVGGGRGGWKAMISLEQPVILDFKEANKQLGGVKPVQRNSKKLPGA